MKLAQLLTILAYTAIAWWHIAPHLKRLGRAQAMTQLLWVHAFRYCVLYIYVARHEGYAISDAALSQLVYGDLTGAALATMAIVALRFRLRVGLTISWLLAAATFGDLAAALYQRSIEPPRADATGVWWVIFVFFAPAIFVSVPLMVWQLATRRGESLNAGIPLIEAPN